MVKIKRNNVIAFTCYMLINLVTLVFIVPIDYSIASIGVFVLTIIIYMVLGKFLTKQQSHIKNLLSISSILFFNLLLWIPALFPDKRALPEFIIPFANNGFFCFLNQYGLPAVIKSDVDLWKFATVISTFLPTFVLWLAIEIFGSKKSQLLDKIEDNEIKYKGIKRFFLKKVTVALGVFVIAISLLGVILNPKQGSFNHWFMENARWQLTDKVLVNDIEDAVRSHVYGNRKVIVRSNRIVYSVFTIPSKNGKSYKYLGIMGGFIRID